MFIFMCAEQTMLSTDLDFLESVEAVKMHLSSQLATRKMTTEQLNAKKRMVRCFCLIQSLRLEFCEYLHYKEPFS